MSDRIRYERLVNTGNYEHMRLSVEYEIPNLDEKAVKQTVERVDRWAQAIKKRIELGREIEFADREIKSLESWATQEGASDEYKTRFKDVQVLKEKLVHEFEDDWWDGDADP